MYLAGLRGATALVGINDPLRGRSPEEVASALEEARDTLAARHFLAVEADETIALDFDVARVVDTVARPRRSLFAYLVDAAATDALETGVRRVFHLRGSLAVELVADDAHERVQLVPLDGRPAIADAVLGFWAVADQPAAQDGAAAVIPQQALRRAVAIAAADGAQAAERSLLELEIGPLAARALATTLARPRRNAALLALQHSGLERHTLGIGMLEGDNGLWRLRPMPADAVELTPCSGPQLAEQIRAFVAAAS